eukprot:3924975-Prymnesium_polylepis.1
MVALGAASRRPLVGAPDPRRCSGSRYPKYDMGPSRNLRQVFGRNRWLWAVPVYGEGPQGDGVHWPTNDGGRVGDAGAPPRPPPVQSSTSSDGAGGRGGQELDRSPDGYADCEAAAPTPSVGGGDGGKPPMDVRGGILASKQFMGGGYAPPPKPPMPTASGAGPSMELQPVTRSPASSRLRRGGETLRDCDAVRSVAVCAAHPGVGARAGRAPGLGRACRCAS